MSSFFGFVCFFGVYLFLFDFFVIFKHFFYWIVTWDIFHAKSTFIVLLTDCNGTIIGFWFSRLETQYLYLFFLFTTCLQLTFLFKSYVSLHPYSSFLLFDSPFPLFIHSSLLITSFIHLLFPSSILLTFPLIQVSFHFSFIFCPSFIQPSFPSLLFLSLFFPLFYSALLFLLLILSSLLFLCLIQVSPYFLFSLPFFCSVFLYPPPLPYSSILLFISTFLPLILLSLPFPSFHLEQWEFLIPFMAFCQTMLSWLNICR